MSVSRYPVITSSTTYGLKRSFDILVATLGLLVLGPLLALIALLVRLDSSGPSLFRQERVGRNERRFVILKFRSMIAQTSKCNQEITVGRDPRVTRLGAFLRRYKLDELPQLLNVLWGHMSIVGPRPEVPRFMALYSAHQSKVICSVRPGMTDYASILFRDESAMLEGLQDPEAFYVETIMPIKYRYYARYIKEIGLWTDIRIILATVSLLTVKRTLFIGALSSETPQLQSQLFAK